MLKITVRHFFFFALKHTVTEIRNISYNVEYKLQVSYLESFLKKNLNKFLALRNFKIKNKNYFVNKYVISHYFSFSSVAVLKKHRCVWFKSQKMTKLSMNGGKPCPYRLKKIIQNWFRKSKKCSISWSTL